MLLPGVKSFAERYRPAMARFAHLRPAAMAPCETPGRVTDAARYARARGLPIAVRGGGHDVAGRGVRPRPPERWPGGFRSTKAGSFRSTEAQLAGPEPGRPDTAFRRPSTERRRAVFAIYDPDGVFTVKSQ